MNAENYEAALGIMRLLRVLMGRTNSASVADAYYAARRAALELAPEGVTDDTLPLIEYDAATNLERR